MSDPIGKKSSTTSGCAQAITFGTIRQTSRVLKANDFNWEPNRMECAARIDIRREAYGLVPSGLPPSRGCLPKESVHEGQFTSNHRSPSSEATREQSQATPASRRWDRSHS